MTCRCPLGPTRECHCTRCGRHFSTVGNFDRHRKGGQCVDPSTVGLALAHRGVWVHPGMDASWYLTESTIGAA